MDLRAEVPGIDAVVSELARMSIMLMAIGSTLLTIKHTVIITPDVHHLKWDQKNIKFRSNLNK